MAGEDTLKVDLFGDRGADYFDDAITACHLFAQATDCPAGGDVVKWFDQQMKRFQDAARHARTEASQ